MDVDKLLDDAYSFAAKVHKGATRKIGKTPYILHPMEACVIAGTMTSDPEVLAAALLHDTIEDAGVTEEDIRKQFGDRVANLVKSETEIKAHGWKQRKKESIEELKKSTDTGVKILWLSDKLSNMRSFVRLYRAEGSGIWNFTNQHDPSEQAWYYTSIADALKELQEFEAYKEYMYLLNIIFTEYLND